MLNVRFPVMAADLNGKLEAENGKPEMGNGKRES